MLTWALCIVMNAQPIRICELQPSQKACDRALADWSARAIEYGRRAHISILGACVYDDFSDDNLLVEPMRRPTRERVPALGGHPSRSGVVGIAHERFRTHVGAVLARDRDTRSDNS